jgi:hypothetical protein
MLTLEIQSEQGTSMIILTLAIQSEQGTNIRMLTLENTVRTRNKH